VALFCTNVRAMIARCRRCDRLPPDLSGPAAAGLCRVDRCRHRRPVALSLGRLPAPRRCGVPRRRPGHEHPPPALRWPAPCRRARVGQGMSPAEAMELAVAQLTTDVEKLTAHLDPIARHTFYVALQEVARRWLEREA